jgi:hypothetical protein
MTEHSERSREVVHETPALDSAGTRADLLRHMRR